MLPNRRVTVPLLFFLVVSLLLLIVQCQPAPTPTPATPTAVFHCEPGEAAAAYETTAYYVQDQLIVTGPRDVIEEIIQTLAESGIELALVEDCNLDFLNNVEGRGDLYPERFPFPPVDQQDDATTLILPPTDSSQDPLTMRLYELRASDMVTETVGRINELGSQAGVYADPNYLTGHLAKTSCSKPLEGDPFGVEGSPFGVEGSPFGVEGSTGSGLGLDADPSGFWAQWAFQQIGLETLGQEERQRLAQGSHVAVFDTSPFTSPGSQTASAIAPALVLNVSHPFVPAHMSATISTTGAVKDHGLFVAGLAHAVAPGSSIHLIRVLDDQGCGDLFTLSKALYHFTSQMAGEDGRLQNVVINLSLGVGQPRNAPELGLPRQVISLQWAFFEPYLRGAVIVAAAGNDSLAHHLRLPMQLPAAYPFVIGVAASNMEQGPACYSNKGNVVAPGGDASLVEDQQMPLCQPLAATCVASGTAPGQCGWGLVSLSNSATNTGYAYWVGSSFATPLVSGLAALAWNGRTRDGVYTAVTTNLTPIHLIEPADADFGPGVIHVGSVREP